MIVMTLFAAVLVLWLVMFTLLVRTVRVYFRKRRRLDPLSLPTSYATTNPSLLDPLVPHSPKSPSPGPRVAFAPVAPSTSSPGKGVSFGSGPVGKGVSFSGAPSPSPSSTPAMSSTLPVGAGTAAAGTSRPSLSREPSASTVDSNVITMWSAESSQHSTRNLTFHSYDRVCSGVLRAHMSPVVSWRQ